MPEYEIVTEQVTKRKYNHSIDLPIDMGEATLRITDRMMRSAAESGALVPFVTDESETELFSEEKVVAVMQGSRQVWPRKKQRKPKPFDDIDPDYEQAVADKQVEFED